ncbi:MAG: hypothetical protein LBT33_06840, partial [Spirochaetia bacterium]|nr:hypothetical protein [Spirochaetia bacterium]
RDIEAQNIPKCQYNKLKTKISPLEKRVGVAEKRFCEAKTFGARGSSVKKALIEHNLLTLSHQKALPPLNLPEIPKVVGQV